MISAHYMREMQKDNERKIERTNEIRRYYSRDEQAKPAQPGILSRLLNMAGSALINFGTRLQCFSAYRQAEF